jgi:hypothetical protein
MNNYFSWNNSRDKIGFEKEEILIDLNDKSLAQEFNSHYTKQRFTPLSFQLQTLFFSIFS